MIVEGPTMVSDSAWVGGGLPPLSEKRRGCWLGRGGQGRRAVAREIRARGRVCACAYTGPLYTPVHYVHPVQKCCHNGFRGQGKTANPVQHGPAR